MTFRVDETAWVRKNTLTKRHDLKYTCYAYKPGIEYPAVAVAICSHVFYGPKDRTLWDHDMLVAEQSKHDFVLESSLLTDWRAGVELNRHCFERLSLRF